MKEFLLHGWHNVVAGYGDRAERLTEIRAHKPANQIDLREKLMSRNVSLEDTAEWDAVDAKWRPELDAVDAKWQSELDAVDAKWRSEWDAVHAKWQSEWDAVHAKWRSEWDAVHAKWRSEWDAVHAKWQSELDAFHARVCVPNCPWDGQTIFTHRKRDVDGAWSDWCMRDEGEAVPQDKRII
ncbi:MAG: hypothetical protein A2W25_15465 [candidate division Zixibacteria bacterium RBG_16_53_22]|nr:MAG: hypothetical protein A2W25_15465 [candidate division Zixibacteria bacterium RBG_16_53_22]